jgi:hypothetical protein
MATKTFFFSFGTPGASFLSLSPSFITFQSATGTTLAAPGVTARISTTGAYQFDYDADGLTAPIFFEIDGGAGVTPANRYVQGTLDPIGAVDQRLTAIGATLNSKIGTTADSYGSSSADPTTVFGYMKRSQEFNEGNSSFNKSSGLWTVQSRSGVTTLALKTLTNGVTLTTKA